ncbi:uncharacterized protein LOC132722749 isoform X2 [Ruditapes philippinarum]|uniref:uncharacterized protein LOC132722749 isoform X2 n=2 Tax=Ruditapes philippinarum TaxID=129788 RepID=UPI00295B5DE9|nr:uncharacterized protein LOC132722749 isoform X2 [Ruditapes philippinarum]
MYSVREIKTLDYLADKNRLIVAGMYLKNDHIAFVDRKNSVLIVTNTENQSFRELDLVQLLPDQYRAKNAKNIPKPSDVNKGFEDDQLLITYTNTYTGNDFSLAIACRFDVGMIELGPPLHVVRINAWTRSVIAIDKDNVCALTEYNVIIKNKDDNDDAQVTSYDRIKSDKGGLLMTDGQGNFYYGDGHSFVWCYWDGINIDERNRLTDNAQCSIKFPRGSAIEPTSGRIFICTDLSFAIYSISSDWGDVKEEVSGKGKQYGDIDFNSHGNRFFTTFWKDNEWPILYGLEA